MTLVYEAIQPVAETFADIRRAQGKHIARINEHTHTLNYFSIEMGDLTTGIAELAAAVDSLAPIREAVEFGRTLNALRMDVGEFSADVASLRNVLGDLQASTNELKGEMILVKQALDRLTSYLNL